MKPFSNSKGTASKLGADFLLSKEPFSLPEEMGSLDPATKRQLTICNLFYHHQQSVPDVMRVLDETYECVIVALIENRLILDRRKEKKTILGNDRRRSRALNEMGATSQETGFARRLRSTIHQEASDLNCADSSL